MLLCKQNSRDIFVSETTANKKYPTRNQNQYPLKYHPLSKSKTKNSRSRKTNPISLRETKNQNPTILNPKVYYPKNQMQVSKKNFSKKKAKDNKPSVLTGFLVLKNTFCSG